MKAVPAGQGEDSPPCPAHLLAPADASPPWRVGAVPPSLVGVLWRFLREHLSRRRRNGGVVRPDERAFVDALRSAYLRQLHSSGHPVPQIPDITSPSTQARTGRGELVRTAELAAALGVTDRHARRLARAAGLRQAARGWWRADDAARLIESRR